MLAPTIVYDLDGTLADTAEDLVAALNWLLAREGLAPLPVESAGSLLGAGARALIKRGFAASGKTLDPQTLEALFADFLEHYNAHIVDSHPALSRRREGARRVRARRLAPGRLHQQDRKLGQAPDRKGSASPTASPSSAARTRSASASRTPKPLLETDRRLGRRERARDHGRGFGHRHQDRPRRGRARDRGRLRLYRRSGRGARAGPGDLAFRSAHRSVRRTIDRRGPSHGPETQLNRVLVHPGLSFLPRSQARPAHGKSYGGCRLYPRPPFSGDLNQRKGSRIVRPQTFSPNRFTPEASACLEFGAPKGSHSFLTNQILATDTLRASFLSVPVNVDTRSARRVDLNRDRAGRHDEGRQAHRR